MVHLHHRNLLQTMAATIFPPFYRRRAAREQYFCHFIVTARRGNNIFAFLSSPRSAGTIFSRFIVTAQRGNNIFAFYRHRAAREQYFCVLSSPCGAGTIFLLFYRHRAAREQYFCCFIVTVRRGNNIFAFYRHRAAREQYFYLSVLAVLLQTHSLTVLAFAGQLRAFRNVARTARGWRRASCRGENEKQPSEME